MNLEVVRDRIRLIRVLDKTIEQLAPEGDDAFWLCHLAQCVRLYTDLFLTMNASGEITFAPKPEYKWITNKRLSIRFGRCVRSKFHIALPDPLLCRIVELMQMICMESPYVAAGEDIQILRGVAVMDAYREGVGGSFCMSGEEARYTQLYVDNPDRVGLLVCGDCARALLWTADSGEIYVDRIYSETPYDAARLWGVIGRLKYRHIRHTWQNVTITLSCDPCVYPYLDSFCYGYCRGEKLVLTNTASEHAYYAFHCTDGGRDDYGVVCVECGTMFNCKYYEGCYEEDGYVCSECMSKR